MSPHLRYIKTNLAVYFLTWFLWACVRGIKIERLSSTMVEVELRKHGIIPDVIPEREAPTSVIKVEYKTKDSNVTKPVEFGNEFLPSDLLYNPADVEWPGYFDSDYALVMVDPDSPSRADPHQREKCHWLLVNIPGNELYTKETIYEYLPPRPDNNTGFHRYVFLIYQQPMADMNFTEPRILTSFDNEQRSKFSSTEFAKKYNFTRPVAVNFFYARDF